MAQMKITGCTINIDNGTKIRIDISPDKTAVCIESNYGATYDIGEKEGVLEFCRMPLLKILKIAKQLAEEELQERRKEQEKERSKNPDANRFSNIEIEAGQDSLQDKNNVVQFPVKTDERFSLLEID